VGLLKQQALPQKMTDGGDVVDNDDNDNYNNNNNTDL
jgi:hypothetical protein